VALVVGATLVLLGFIGLALFGTKASETELDEEFSEEDHEPPKTPIELALAQQEQDRKVSFLSRPKSGGRTKTTTVLRSNGVIDQK
jgi:hypothetical protein